jgi:hypothetical protein
MKTRRPPRIAATPGDLACPPPVTRRDQVHLELLTTVDSLPQRRGGGICVPHTP